jgi:hypothetical protein
MPNIYDEIGVNYAFTKLDEPSFKEFKYWAYYIKNPGRLLGRVWCRTEADFKKLLKYWSRTKYWKYKPFNEGDIMTEYKFTEQWKNGFSVKHLKEASACETELNRFAYAVLKDGEFLFDGKLDLPIAVSCAKTCNGGIDWLLARGFIEVVEPEVTYKIGQKFYNDQSKRYFMLASAGPNGQVILVNMHDGTRKHSFQIKAANLDKITADEFDKITMGTPIHFKLVENLMFVRTE